MEYFVDPYGLINRSFFFLKKKKKIKQSSYREDLNI